MLMGLDMYLTGEKFHPNRTGTLRESVDGYPVQSKILDLGYWRKHWALHDYIVNQFPAGEYKVELDSDKLREIADHVKCGKLVDPDDGEEMPHYKSVYEFHREPEQVKRTVETFTKAADWLDRNDNFWRSVYYEGSS
jgi:hypothetical protein